MNGGLRYDEAYAGDPVRRRAMLELATLVFRNDDMARFSSLGLWDPSFTPFSYFDGHSCVANVAIVDLPLVAAGRPIRAGGVQAVATHPDYRRRGLFTELIRRMLTYAETRYESILLFTEAPPLYEPFGFRVVSDDLFVASAPSPRRRFESRPLSIQRDADVELVRSSLARRAAASNVLSVRADPALLLFNEVRHDLTRTAHVPALDALLVSERCGSTLRLLELIAPRIPALAEILACFDPPIERVEFAFTPDLFDCACDVTPRRDGDYLMVCGQFPPEGRPFAFPAPWYF